MRTDDDLCRDFPATRAGKVELRQKSFEHCRLIFVEPGLRKVSLVAEQAPAANKHDQHTDPARIDHCGQYVDVALITDDILLLLDSPEMTDLVSQMRGFLKLQCF